MTSLARRGLFAAPLLISPSLACTRVAALPLRLVEGYPIVPAVLAGQAVSFLLDTGAQGMLVTQAAADALRLPLSGMTRIYGTGGSQAAHVVGLPGLRLDGAPIEGLLAPVAPLPMTLDVVPPVAGLLGAALLSRFDLALDVPNGRVTLWSPGGCPEPAGTRLPLARSRAGEAYVPVRVNGQTLLALVDTGSRATLLSDGAARLLRLSAPQSANTARGIDGQRQPLAHVRVQMALGDERPRDTPVSITPLQLDRGDMLLGLDQLGQRAVWIGYAAGAVVFAR